MFFLVIEAGYQGRYTVSMKEQLNNRTIEHSNMRTIEQTCSRLKTLAWGIAKQFAGNEVSEDVLQCPTPAAPTIT